MTGGIYGGEACIGVSRGSGGGMNRQMWVGTEVLADSIFV